MITPGPATLCATRPATKYIPVPTQDPTPRDVKSRVVKHLWNTPQSKIQGDSTNK